MKFFIRILIFQIIFSGLASPGLMAEEKKEVRTASYYQCSMHPWITSDKPGNCPVCGMKLTKVHNSASGAPAAHGRSSLEISPERLQQIGTTFAKTEMRPLVYSVHSVGHVAYDPDIATTLSEYRQAFAAYRKSRGNPSENIRDRAMKLMELAELKLRLSGMSSEQSDLVKTASFDTRILNNFFAPSGLILPEGHVWIDTDLYESDSELVKPGDEVIMSAPALPGKIFKGTVRTSDAILNEFPRRLRVRVETEHAGVLKAGMALDMRIMVSLGERLTVPETAIIDSGLSQTVFVYHGEGKIEPREVQIGQQGDGYYEIVAGLHEGENVITSAVFLIDSESRLKAAAQGFSNPQSKEAAPASGHAH